MKADGLAQADLLIADRLSMRLESVAALTDGEWAEALAMARWLEEREIERIKAGTLAAIAAAFGR